jgi:hypothetical protein
MNKLYPTPLFVTLTYQGFPTAKKAKRDLKVFSQRLKRRYPQVCGIWRVERQERGSIHFHLILWGISWLEPSELAELWTDVSDPGNQDALKASTSVERVRSSRGTISYVSKYIAKTTNDSIIPGRQWGYIDRPKVYAMLDKPVIVPVPYATAAEMLDKYASKIGLNIGPHASKIDVYGHYAKELKEEADKIARDT